MKSKFVCLCTLRIGESPTLSLETELIVAGTPVKSRGVARKIRSFPISNPVVTICSELKRVLSSTGQSYGKSYETKFHCLMVSKGGSPTQFVLMINDTKIVILTSSCIIILAYLPATPERKKMRKFSLRKWKN